jgi:hypothetical protein
MCVPGLAGLLGGLPNGLSDGFLGDLYDKTCLSGTLKLLFLHHSISSPKSG